MGLLGCSLIQSQLHWEDKNANLQMFEQKINSITTQTHVVILPEMFSTGFSMQPEKFAEKMDGSTVEWMKKIASSKKIILTGSIIIEEEQNYFNRLLLDCLLPLTLLMRAMAAIVCLLCSKVASLKYGMEAPYQTL